MTTYEIKTRVDSDGEWVTIGTAYTLVAAQQAVAQWDDGSEFAIVSITPVTPDYLTDPRP